jgi:hypothetical protein
MAAPRLRCRFTPSLIGARVIEAQAPGPLGPLPPLAAKRAAAPSDLPLASSLRHPGGGRDLRQLQQSPCQIVAATFLPLQTTRLRKFAWMPACAGMTGEGLG